MKISISMLISALVLFVTSSANAMQIDTDQLDLLKPEEVGAFGPLRWSGVSVKLAVGYDGQATREIVAKSDVRIDRQVEMYMSPAAGVGALTRITKKDDGSTALEHVEVAVDGDSTVLRVTKRSSVRVVEVARIDSGLERAKSVPVYAYRTDAEHVTLVALSPGVSVSKNGSEECDSHSRGCVFSNLNWKDVMIDLTLGPEQRVGQLRGDIAFEQAPKGVQDEPHGYIVNATFAKIGREASPVLSLSTRTRLLPPSTFSEED